MPATAFFSPWIWGHTVHVVTAKNTTSHNSLCRLDACWVKNKPLIYWQSWKSNCSQSIVPTPHCAGYSKLKVASQYIMLLFVDSVFWTGTCSLTLAVSRGNVTMSAIQAAAPALAIFTPRGGGTSDGLSPTMFPTVVKQRHTQDQISVEFTHLKIHNKKKSLRLKYTYIVCVKSKVPVGLQLLPGRP